MGLGEGERGQINKIVGHVSALRPPSEVLTIFRPIVRDIGRGD